MFLKRIRNRTLRNREYVLDGLTEPREGFRSFVHLSLGLHCFIVA